LATDYLLAATDVPALTDMMTPRALAVLRRMLETPDESARFRQHFQDVSDDRDRIAMSKAVSAPGDEVHLAIAYNRIIWRAARLTNPDMLPVDLNAEECLDVMERVAALYGGRWCIGAALARANLSPKRLISHYRMNAAALAHVEQVLTQRYHAALCSPSDMVGIVAAQSIAEPSTQMVLNSVTWDTELLISIDGVLTKTTIGEFTDGYMESTAGTPDLEAHPQDTHLAWIKDRDVRIGSIDEEGRAHWTQVEACTRHPVVNEDGSNTVYKVTVRSGAEVTVTRGKGLLKRIGNKIVHATVDDFKVGDYLPMAATLQPDVPEISTLDLIDWVSPTKAVYMSEAAKAIDFYHNGGMSGRSAANRTVKPATDTAQLDDPSAQDRNPSGGATARDPSSRCRSNGPTPSWRASTSPRAR
jgi:hypothetical protein